MRSIELTSGRGRYIKVARPRRLQERSRLTLRRFLGTKLGLSPNENLTLNYSVRYTTLGHDIFIKAH